MKRNTLVLIGVAVAGALLSIPVQAIPISWNIAGNGLFQAPGNWNPAQIPMFGDQVFFQNGASPTVSFTSTAFSESLAVTTGNVTFNMAGANYILSGNVDIGGGLPGPIGPDPLATPTVSLAVNSGVLSAAGLLSIHNDAALKGSGTVNANQVMIFPGGQLRGSMMIGASGPGSNGLLNAGAVAPGNPLGIMTINGDYHQSVDGLLQIEVGGLTVGTQYDRLVVNGAASLGGRLDLPIINGFTPMPPAGITFLQAQSVTGAFDFITAPGLPGATVAVQLVMTPSGVDANFVAPTSTSLLPNPSLVSWGDPNAWSGGTAPKTTDVVTIANSMPFPVRVNLDAQSPASRNAFAHRVNLSSAFEPLPTILGIPEGTALSAIDQVAVGENGSIEMFGGSVYTQQLRIESHGKVAGSGTIHGDVVVGTGMGTGSAILAPSSEGTLSIDQDLTINTEGVLAVSLENEFNFGRVAVGGNVTLGGRLVIDISNLDPGTPLGTAFEIIAADDFVNHFDSIETIGGNGTVFLAPASLSPLGTCAIGALVVCEGNGFVVLHSIGDMNFDGVVNADDAPDFAEALVDPVAYLNNHCFVPATSAGDYIVDGTVDFDDIAPFVADVETLTAADIFALINQLSTPEPASGGLLLWGSCLLLAVRPRPRRRLTERSL